MVKMLLFFKDDEVWALSVVQRSHYVNVDLRLFIWDMDLRGKWKPISALLEGLRTIQHPYLDR